MQSGLSLREQYKAADDNGLPTPLSDIPLIPDSVKFISERFFDVYSHKDTIDSKMSLSVMESYSRVFNVNIHPFVARMIVHYDRVATSKILDFIK